MELEVVSKKILLYCLIASSFLLIITIGAQYFQPNYLYICNDNNLLDIYKRENNKNIIINPQNLKNVLHCLGKGMPFYDRNIYNIEGRISLSLKNELLKRYKITKISKIKQKSFTYCIESKTRYLVIQKVIQIDTINRALYKCKPSKLLIADINDIRLFKASLSRKYEIVNIPKGKSVKIRL